jgi:hypothetical protein
VKKTNNYPVKTYKLFSKTMCFLEFLFLQTVLSLSDRQAEWSQREAGSGRQKAPEYSFYRWLNLSGKKP